MTKPRINQRVLRLMQELANAHRLFIETTERLYKAVECEAGGDLEGLDEALKSWAQVRFPSPAPFNDLTSTEVREIFDQCDFCPANRSTL